MAKSVIHRALWSDRGLCGRGCWCRLRLLRFGFAFAYPALNPELTVNGVRFGKAVVNVRPQSVQRHATPVILLDTRQFRAAEPPCAPDFDAFGAEIFGRLQRFLHRSPEGNAPLQLQGHVLRDQLRVNFRVFDLENIYINLFAGHAAELFLELVDFRSFAADDDARAGRHDRDAAAAGGALDQDLGHRGRLEFLLEQLANVA